MNRFIDRALTSSGILSFLGPVNLSVLSNHRSLPPVRRAAWILAACAGLAVSAPLQAAPKAPDIVFILTDDMGYSDPGCFGGELTTPTLDRLAEQGIRLTHCFNGGMCVISRTSFLTGCGWPSGTRKFSKTQLLPERLQKGGYRTGLFGKWHLPGHPMDHGFDRFFGFLGGFSSHYSGGKDYRLDREPFTDFGKDYYSTEAFTDRAVDFIEKSVVDGPEDPFFLFLSYQAPHNPLQAREADIQRHRGKYRGGWQAIREARFARQKKLGIIPPTAKLPTYPENLPDWDSLSDAQVDLEDLRMATYAAMVEGIDAGVAQVVRKLSELGRLENTLLIFASDNGADPFSSADPAMLKRGLLPGDPGSNFQPGFGWAYASVTPWRMYKIAQHAGGVTTGAIIHWPKGIARRGTIAHTGVHFSDLMPTILESAGLPAGKLDGESFLPILQGKEWQRKEPMCFQYMDNRAIRTAEWTLAEVDGSGWELYRISTDPLETEDVSAAHPEVVDALGKQWETWWKDQSGKDYKPKSTATGPHYTPQGDRGTGKTYVPSAMPKRLKR